MIQQVRHMPNVPYAERAICWMRRIPAWPPDGRNICWMCYIFNIPYVEYPDFGISLRRYFKSIYRYCNAASAIWHRAAISNSRYKKCRNTICGDFIPGYFRACRHRRYKRRIRIYGGVRYFCCVTERFYKWRRRLLFTKSNGWKQSRHAATHTCKSTPRGKLKIAILTTYTYLGENATPSKAKSRTNKRKTSIGQYLQSKP